MGIESTTVAVSGGGPAGITLGLLLARAGVEVTVLEKHADFFNDFRGDTVHPATLQIIDELGLTEEFESLPHRKVQTITVGGHGTETIKVDLAGIPGNYQYIAMVPQWDFLSMLARRAELYPNFRLLMSAKSTGLIDQDGTIRGLSYSDTRGDHELHAALTVSADGRHSKLRQDAGMIPTELGSPMGVLWLRVSRDPKTIGGLHGRMGSRAMAFAVDRGDYWQVSYIFNKDGAGELLSRPVEFLQRRLLKLLPFLDERVREVDSWQKVAFLEVRLNRLERWYRPGYLCIGDAAHAMTPVGGVGVNLAVQDAVATANTLADTLYRTQKDPDYFRRTPDTQLLNRIQQRRRLPTAGTQMMQQFIERQLFGSVLYTSENSTRPTRRSPMKRILGARLEARMHNRLYSRLISRIMMRGIRPEHVRTPERK